MERRHPYEGIAGGIDVGRGHPYECIAGVLETFV
jgi:hypothetical protein